MANARNRGHAALLAKTEQRGSKARVARLIGCKPNQITQWLRDGINPGGPNRTKLEKTPEIAIPSSWWDEPVEGAT